MGRRSFLVPVEGGLSAVAALFSEMDRELTRVAMEDFAGEVAVETALRIDLHRCGLEVRPRDGCPLIDAIDAVRGRWGTERVVRALATFGENRLCLTFAALDDVRGRVVTGLLPDAVEGDPQAGDVPLLFQHPRSRLPAPKWVSVRKRIPPFGDRVRAVERWAGRPSQGRFETTMPAGIDRDEMRTYGAPRPGPALTVPRASERPSNAPTFVDHADFVRTFDNNLFVAIMDAGISPKDRVILHLSDREISFLQGGKVFGTVVDVPSRVGDLLKSKKTVNVVEMRRGAGRSEVKARHVAMVRDVSSGDGAGSLLGAWKLKAIGGSQRIGDKHGNA